MGNMRITPPRKRVNGWLRKSQLTGSRVAEDG